MALCYGGDVQVPYWSKYCNHGIWNSSGETCKCTTGSTGARCDIYRQSCDDLNNAGLIKGNYRVVLDLNSDSTVRIKVVCQIYPHVPTSKVVVTMNGGRLAPNMTWSEYKHGFYVDSWNFWIGLEAWRLIATRGLDDVTVFALIKGKISGTSILGEFKVGSEGTNYRGTHETIAYSPMPALIVVLHDRNVKTII